MSPSEFPEKLSIRSRPTTSISLDIPTDTLQTIEQIALHQNTSVEALLKRYIGYGLRQDVAQQFANQVLELTAQVLVRHGQSQEEVKSIVHEIWSATQV